MGSPRDFPIKAEAVITTAMTKGHRQAVMKVGDKIAACFFWWRLQITQSRAIKMLTHGCFAG